LERGSPLPLLIIKEGGRRLTRSPFVSISAQAQLGLVPQRWLPLPLHLRPHLLRQLQVFQVSPYRLLQGMHPLQ
jgi:hypothetical protein